MNNILQTVHYKPITLFLLVIATVTSLLGNSLLWQTHQALFQWILPSASLLLVLRLGWHVRQISLAVSPSTLHKDIKLCWIALLLCTGGDIVNFNLFELYHRQDQTIKHDYLIDSIWFFALGYGLLLWLLIKFLRREFALKLPTATVLVVLSVMLSSVSYQMMYLPTISQYSLLLSACYSVLVTLLGVFGFWLLVQNLKLNEKTNYAVACGFILAMLADAIIGQFWLFANQGDGYFPIARHVNWVIYIGSQTLLLLFPIAMIKTNVARYKE
ncbi:hypothetical protein [Pseudoalteromonas piscicida]|uniref:Uncharacterized protein n=1 Tax=Pseudoalteromonas piscicida TaxID=43662 RepID=A0AAD0W6P3_PSEO7|nr:hypothetical protein [Pseudoalteromonas piscicida]AXR04173.1 hypothetical protein D0511_19730 [Pseudoalteromonas piscicida]